jgi:hypothetical protein
VGRYFPLTIATALPRYVSVVSSPGILADWLHHAEETALEALSQSLSVEEVLARVRNHPLPEVHERAVPGQAEGQSSWSGQAMSGEFWSENLLDQIVYRSFERPCHWSTVEADTGAVRYLLTEGFRGFNALFAS